jgi:CRP-like cAMP-binding protein
MEVRRFSRYITSSSEGRLRSEVPAEVAATYLAEVLDEYNHIIRLTELEITVLVEHMSVMRFGTGEMVVQAGEAGTWFGVLLSGTLDCELGQTAPSGTQADGQRSYELRKGAVVGEMAIWHPGAIRSATLRGGAVCCCCLPPPSHRRQPPSALTIGHRSPTPRRARARNYRGASRVGAAGSRGGRP